MNDAKLVRFAAVLVVLAGYAFVFRAGEGRIAAQAAENVRSSERLDAGERALTGRAELERERDRLRAQLGPADLGRSRGDLVAGFVRAAAALARAHHCTIVAVAAAGAQSSALPIATAQVPHEPFEAIALETTVEGRYADVLALVRALSAAPVLAAVDIASFARKNADAPDPTVSALLHVAIQRLTAGTRTDGADARAR
jgi:hypothetical protein